jgi:hypothetical protein
MKHVPKRDLESKSVLLMKVDFLGALPQEPHALLGIIRNMATPHKDHLLTYQDI